MTLHVSASVSEQEHVALVDPATTKCTVCHKRLEATHAPEALEEGCLRCHTFVKQEDATYLVDVDPASSGEQPTARAEPAETVSGEAATPDGGSAGVRSEPPAAQPAPVAATSQPPATRPSSSARAAGSESQPRDPEALLQADHVRDESRALYTAGMEAFHRGDVDAAFDSWWVMLEEAANQHTLQIAVDRHLESARHALETYPGHSLYVVPRSGAYYVLAGVYPSRAAAVEGLGRLPDALTRDGAFPVPIRSLVGSRSSDQP